jgi:hypothetical protein
MKKNIPFTINETVYWYVNNKVTQLKYCSYFFNSRGGTFNISINKYAVLKKSSRFNQPYNINNQFEQIIIEFGGPKGENTKYHSNFCIIPKSILKDIKILKDTDNNVSFSICPPLDYENDHWSNIYWNSIIKVNIGLIN